MQCEWLLTRSVLLSVSVLWQAVLPVVAAGTQSNGQKREDNSSRLICTDARKILHYEIYVRVNSCSFLHK